MIEFIKRAYDIQEADDIRLIDAVFEIMKETPNKDEYDIAEIVLQNPKFYDDLMDDCEKHNIIRPSIKPKSLAELFKV